MKPFFLCILFFFTLSVSAQHYAFSPIVSNNGLSENKVRNITQLTDGRMVVITAGMVNLYNGTSFQYIHLNEEKVYSLSGYTGFHRSYVENDKRLWIKNHKKLMLIDLSRERFEQNTDSVLSTLGVKGKLADFFMDSERNLWMLTEDNKLLYRDMRRGKTVTYLSGKSGIKGIPDPLYDLAVLDKKLYLFYRSGLLICYDLASRKEIYRENPLDAKKQKLYNRTLFVVQGTHSLLQLRNGTGGIMLSYNAKSRKWTKVLEEDYGLNTLSIDPKGNILVSCELGLWVINADLTTKRFIPTLHLVDGRSIDTEVSTLYHDNQGGLWIGTLNRGLLYHHPDRFKFKNIGKPLFLQSVKQGLFVSAFSESNGTILVGTRAGLFKYSPDISQIRPYSIELSRVQCNAMLKDSEQRIWLCTPNGLYCIKEQDVQHYPLGNINNLFESSNGTLYLCIDKEGFGRFNPANGSYEKIQGGANGNVNSVKQIVTFKKDFLLGISNAGLFIYNVKKNTLTLPDLQGKEKPEIFRHNNHHYNCLFADSRGLIWFGTQDGLNVWDPAEKRLSSFHTGDGLINNSVQAITEDLNHVVWVSTSSGVSRIVISNKDGKKQYSFANFNRNDGIIEGEFLERSAYITKDGHLLFGGIDGFNDFNLNRISVTRKKLNPLFVGFLLSGIKVKERTPYNGNTILQNSISATREINLNHNQNFFTLEFSALNYINPTQTYYSYLLEGVDKTWNEVSSSNGLGQATYTNLSPGTYIFKVRAANNSKDWGGNAAVLKITIKAPFWATPFAYFIYLFLILSLGYIFISNYLRRSKVELIRGQKEKLDQLKLNFFTNMSHELRTPLTLVLTPLEVIIKKMDEGKLKAQLINIHSNAANLLGLVNQLLDFRNLELNGEKLHLSYCDVCEYISVVCMPFKELAQSKEIEFYWECHVESIYLYLDKGKLDKIINNLLSNAFKFTSAGGVIRLELDKGMLSGQEPALTLKVSDTGYGIPEKDLPMIFDRFFQSTNQIDGNTGSGIGLHLVQEYVQLHRGIVEVESKMGKGTSFTLYIPLNLQPEIKTEEKEFIPNGSHPGSLKVLIVEDNDEFRRFLFNELSESYTVISASNGKEGLEKALDQLPDLVISDVMMPVMSGVELCNTLKKDIRISHIPVILLTARSSEEAQFQGYDAGADAYIAKPFNVDILLIRIRKLIEQQEQRKLLFKNAIVIQPDSITSTNIDEKLIQRALECVEKNIDNSSYSVEQLSSDMNMDRTGLYRKLLSIVGQSPTDFIRSIRLKRAAQLLQQKELSVAEVAYKVGFSSAAYLSKCFQKEFGVKPSEYAALSASK